MIVIKIELWPMGFEKHKRELGRMHIINDGNGTPTRGDYKVQVMRKGSKKVQRTGEVKDYPRQSYTVWRLIQRALRSAFPEEKS